MKRKLLLVLSGAVAASLVLAACGGDTAGPAAGTTPKASDPKAAGPAAATVDMVNNAYNPATVTVSVGESVEFANSDAEIHDVKFEQGENSPTVMNTGDTWTRTFDAAGTFPYVCTYHEVEGMVGTVTVQ